MRIKMHCGIGYVGVEHTDIEDIDDSEFEGMSEEEKEQYILETYVVPFANQYLETWYEEI